MAEFKFDPIHAAVTQGGFSPEKGGNLRDHDGRRAGPGVMATEHYDGDYGAGEKYDASGKTTSDKKYSPNYTNPGSHKVTKRNAEAAYQRGKQVESDRSSGVASIRRSESAGSGPSMLKGSK